MTARPSPHSDAVLDQLARVLCEKEIQMLEGEHYDPPKHIREDAEDELTGKFYAFAVVAAEFFFSKAAPLPEPTSKACDHIHDHVACGSAFNVYRCRYCGKEDWQ
jgi:hypothetical protein